MFAAYCLGNEVDLSTYDSAEDSDYVPDDEMSDGTDDEGVPETTETDDAQTETETWALNQLRQFPAIGSISKFPCDKCAETVNHFVITDAESVYTCCAQCKTESPLCSNEMYKFQCRHYLDIAELGRRR